MKRGLCCLLLLFVAAQARDLTAYGGGSSHAAPSHTTVTDCRTEVGYKIVAKDPNCGSKPCAQGQYCKLLKEVDCRKSPQLQSCLVEFSDD